MHNGIQTIGLIDMNYVRINKGSCTKHLFKCALNTNELQNESLGSVLKLFTYTHVPAGFDCKAKQEVF